ncbi:hypothetical protein M440DRAFT_1198869 [Trichoderma longibrachiatum ATCC 18648]|uniref:Uncharacterized protein n=1 Tax=Trichoderma longibrachiatum ATCC 18648 TaxID=983965 RepID=A0A2T4CAV0_TRILO|nr:hypothetical protein M440DRAFT_1198869 [Trichoderma longibrachiatum ATCC 18648]
MAATTFLCFNLQSTSALPPSCAQISQTLSLNLTTEPPCAQGTPAPLPRIGQPFTRTSHENLQDALPPSVTSGPRSASLRLRHKQTLSCTSSLRSSLLLKLGALLLLIALRWHLTLYTPPTISFPRFKQESVIDIAHNSRPPSSKNSRFPPLLLPSQESAGCVASYSCFAASRALPVLPAASPRHFGLGYIPQRSDVHTGYVSATSPTCRGLALLDRV